MLSAIRQNSNRVRALGANVFNYRMAAYVGSGTLASFAGALMAQHANFISPDIGNWFVSGDVLIAVVIGGIGTLIGPVIGAALLILLKHTLSSLFGYWYLCLGLVFVSVALFTPNGIVGALLKIRDQVCRERKAHPLIGTGRLGVSVLETRGLMEIVWRAAGDERCQPAIRIGRALCGNRPERCRQDDASSICCRAS